MTKAKKAFCLALAVVMVIGVFAFSALAVDQTAEFTVTASETQIEVGDTITVTVAVTTDYYAAATGVPIYYDAAIFDYVPDSLTTVDIFGTGTTWTEANTFYEEPAGLLNVVITPTGQNASAQHLTGMLLTFQLTAKAEGISEIGLRAEDQKTESHIGGLLYCGAYASEDVTSAVTATGQTFILNNTTVTVGTTAAEPNTLKIKDTALYQPVIDLTNKSAEYTGSIYGIDTLGWNDMLTPDGTLADFLTTELGDEYLRITTPDSGVETTGTIIEVLDADGSTVLETYVFVYFGDVDMDGLVGFSDEFVAAYYEINYMGIDTLAQFMAADLDGDGWPTMADGFTMGYYESTYTGMPSQADVAALVSGNYYELI